MSTEDVTGHPEPENTPDAEPAEQASTEAAEAVDDAASSAVTDAAGAVDTTPKPATGVVPVTTGSASTAVEVPQTARELVRERAQQVSARQKRNRVVMRTVLSIVGVIVVAAAAVAVYFAFAGESGKTQGEPKNLTDGGVVITTDMVNATSSAGNGTITTPVPTAEGTQPTAPIASNPMVDIRIYFDYHDADAAAFEVANAKQLAMWLREGAISLSYHPIASVTGQSNGTKYSLRAMSAAGCVASYAPESFFAFTHELLAKQPAVDTPGYTDDELADIAIAIGAADPKKVRSCVENESYAPWAKKLTDELNGQTLPNSDDKLDGSFVVLVNGDRYVGSVDNAAEFTQTVLRISSDPANSTPEPTIDPTVNPTEIAPVSPTEPAPGT